MTTEPLYYQDPYLRSFSATVRSCRRGGEYYEITLDKTAFYPEGGGQPADTGTLNGGKVVDVQERDGDIVHLCDTPFQPGETVTGTLDWDRRFSLMQQHSGEHLVSGIVHRKYGWDNIGFHMSAQTISVDFNGDIPEEDLLEIERAANEAVWSDIETAVFYPDAAELQRLDYRSKKALSGAVRIVRFAEVDTCACCGTHVRRTGEIGLIKLLGCAKAHGGVRIEMVCGRQALQYMQVVQAQNDRIVALLSAKPPETADAVQKLLDNRNETLAQMAQIENRLFEKIARAVDGSENCLLFEDGLSSNGIRDLTIAVMEHCGGICAVFSGDEESGYKYAVGAHDGDLREWAQTMNRALRGRGGGKPLFIQGSVQAGRQEIEAFFSSSVS